MLIVLLKTHFPGWYIVRRAGEGGGGGSIQKETITNDFLFNVNNLHNQETLIIQRSQWKQEKTMPRKVKERLTLSQTDTQMPVDIILSLIIVQSI